MSAYGAACGEAAGCCRVGPDTGRQIPRVRGEELGMSLGQRLDGAEEREYQPTCALGGVCSREGASQGTVAWGEREGAGICKA